MNSSIQIPHMRPRFSLVTVKLILDVFLKYVTLKCIYITDISDALVKGYLGNKARVFVFFAE